MIVSEPFYGRSDVDLTSTLREAALPSVASGRITPSLELFALQVSDLRGRGATAGEGIRLACGAPTGRQRVRSAVSPKPARRPWGSCPGWRAPDLLRSLRLGRAAVWVGQSPCPTSKAWQLRAQAAQVQTLSATYWPHDLGRSLTHSVKWV